MDMKNRTYKIRFSEDEWRKLEAQAGGNVAKYIRSRIFEAQSRVNILGIKGLTLGVPTNVPTAIEDEPEAEPLEYRTDIECMKCGNDNARKRKDRGNLCDTYFNG